MAKMSAARKRHPEITLSLSMSLVPGGLFLCLFLAWREAGHSGDSDVSPFLLSHHRRNASLQVDQFEPQSVCTNWWWAGWFTPPAGEICFSPAQEEWLEAEFFFFVRIHYNSDKLGQTHADGALISSPCSGFPFLPDSDWSKAPPILAITLPSGGQNSGAEHARSHRFPTLRAQGVFWERACCFWQQ